jgi:hypothetical protein
MKNLKIYWNKSRKTADIYIEAHDPRAWPSYGPLAVVYLARNEEGYLVAEQEEPLMKMAALFAAAPQLLEALEKLRGIEAHITDGAMRTLFQETVYPAIEKAKDNSYFPPLA